MISTKSAALASVRALALACLAAGALLAGCASRVQPTDSFLGFITPYRIDIIQGNVVTRELVTLVRPGMTRAQVRETLGSPMLTDPFHGDRWDYLFTIRRPGTAAQRYSVVVRFDGDQMKSVDAPADLPSENEFVSSVVPPVKGGKTPALELTEAQRKALPLPPRVAPAPVAAAAPTREYPPLERP